MLRKTNYMSSVILEDIGSYVNNILSDFGTAANTNVLVSPVLYFCICFIFYKSENTQKCSCIKVIISIRYNQVFNCAKFNNFKFFHNELVIFRSITRNSKSTKLQYLLINTLVKYSQNSLKKVYSKET